MNRSLTHLALLGLPLLLGSCNTPGYNKMLGTSASRPPPPQTLTAASSSTAATPATTGAAATTSSHVRAATASSTLPPPDAQLLYQRTGSDAFGHTTQTGIIQQRGGVVEETYIGNRPVYGTPFPAGMVDGIIQPGYVPTGTSMVYDPITGRMIPVRRH